jgi:STE24 endopeptidase
LSTTLLLLVGLHLALRLTLSLRQIRHVRQHASAVPAAFEGSISPAAHARAAAYAVARQKLAIAELLLSTTLLVLLTWGGGLAALAGLLGSVLPGDGVAAGVALAAAAFALLGLAGLPLEAVQTFGVEARFGFNRMGPGLFLADALRGVLVSALLGLPLVAAFLWLMQALPQGWWLAAWALWSVFSLALMVIAPRWILPLFNRFTPLSDPALVARISALLQRTGFSSEGVFTMDGSRRSSHGNAYFTGLGPAKRVVFFDTLMAQLQPEELEAVLAHELGHFRLRHIAWRQAGLLVMALGALGVLGWLRSGDSFLPALGFTATGSGLRDAATLVDFLLLAPMAGLLLAPLLSFGSRRHEFQADAFALRHCPGDALARALVKLTRDNAGTLTPDPWYTLFHASHPPVGQRLARLQMPASAGAAPAVA